MSAGRRSFTLAASAVSLIAAVAAMAAGDGAKEKQFGHSIGDAPLTATRIGDRDARRVALVVGVIHGDETAGLKVTEQLRQIRRRLRGVELWLVDTLNPDGQRTGSRRNARGVDLNRNFPRDWHGGVPPSSGYYPGRGPASEPETRAAMRLIRRIEPDLTIWYHQPWGAVLACHGTPRVAVAYARLARMQTSCRARNLPGTAVGWQRRELSGSKAFVVELPAGSIGSRTARRHARAVAQVAKGRACQGARCRSR